MRQIKFRAWDKKDKLMYHNVQDGIDFDDESHYEFKNFLGNQEPDDYHKWELMQYTGLKDKNNVEIFEGDIVTWGDAEKPSIIIYKEAGFEIGKTHYPLRHKGKEVEVIGNKFENPELLK